MEKAQFEKMAHSLRPRLVAKAAAVVRDDMTADDIAQDALLKLWSIRHRLDLYDSVEALAIVITYRLSLNHLRDHGRRCDIDIDCACSLASGDPMPDELVMQSETEIEIGNMLARLPSGQAAILRMKHVDGMETAEIAALINSTEGAVRTSLSRARQRIAELYAPSTSHKHVNDTN